MAETFDHTVSALFKCMEEFVSSKTVVGEAIHAGDAIILPLVDVSFGMMASCKAEPQKHNGGGGMGGKMTPNALLVIQNGAVRLVNVKNQDALTKIIDAAPELLGRLKGGKKKEDPVVEQACEEAGKKTETF